MNNRISDTIYDVTGLYRNLKYPERMLQWMLKGDFFRKSLCWYLENRFSVRSRSLTDEALKHHMVVHGTIHMLRDISIREKDDPTNLIRAMLTSFYSHVEVYLRNPCGLYLENEPLVNFTPIDLPSDHPYKFKMLKPRRDKRKKTDQYGFHVMSKKHYYLTLRQGDNNE